MDIFYFILGCSLLWQGGDLIVSGATNIARRFSVSELIIGLTLVSIGTSLPEVVVNIIASIKQESDVVIGNILGSNMSNTCLILGATGVLSPLIIPTCRLRNEIKFYFACLLFLCLLFFLPSSNITIVAGVILLIGFLYSIYLFFMPKPIAQEKPLDHPKKPIIITFLFFVLGCILLPLGGNFMVNSAINIANSFGLSKVFISLFAVALGTSLPELATSVIAAKKGNTNMALGNILGSNIFNITLVLGLSSMISTIQISSLFKIDLCILIVMTIPLGWLLIKTNKTRLNNYFSYSMLILYIVYLVYIFYR